jgi:hypothetical protein
VTGCVGVGGTGLGVEVGSWVAVGGTGLCVGVAVALGISVGGCAVSVGRRTMVGSGGTSWPHAPRRTAIAARHRSAPTSLVFRAGHSLFITQRIYGVEACRSQRRVETEDHPYYEGEGGGQDNGLQRDHRC